MRPFSIKQKCCEFCVVIIVLLIQPEQFHVLLTAPFKVIMVTIWWTAEALHGFLIKETSSCFLPRACHCSVSLLSRSVKSGAVLILASIAASIYLVNVFHGRTLSMEVQGGRSRSELGPTVDLLLRRAGRQRIKK